MSATSRAMLSGGELREIEVLRDARAATYGTYAFTVSEASFGETPTFQQALAQTSSGVDRQATLAYGLPDAAAGATWLAGSPRVQAAVENNGELLSVGLISGESYVRHSSSRISFEIDTTSLEGDESLYFGLLGVDSTGLGFNALHVQLEANGNTVFDESFSDSASANASLYDLIVATRIDGADVDGLVEMVVHMDLDFGAGSGNLAFAVFSSSSVPEPSLIALFACLAAAGGLARARRRVPSATR